MSDVEPEPTPGTPADLDKEGGLKDEKARPLPDTETEEDAHGAEGGMIGEG